MPRSNNIAVQNNFSKGLVTEATGLTFPENACTDTDNCIFDRTGLVTRRFSFDFESQYEENAVTLTGSVVVTYEWRDPAGDGNTIITVQQIGDTLTFYKASTSSSLSSGIIGTTIDLTDFAPSGVSTVKDIECQFASGNGDLFVTNPHLNTFYVRYDPDANTVAATQIDLMIRDIIDGDKADILAVDARPAVNFSGLTAFHHYNLLNQSWTDDLLHAWDSAQTDMPANSDVSWYYKNASGDFSFTDVDKFSLGNTPASKGHYIFSVYDIDRDSIVTGATSEEIPTERVSTCAFFAGRVFYAGINAQGQNSKILFSQIIQSETQYGLCYQQNDPTSEKLFNLLATDGGVAIIPEIGNVIKMIPYQNSLLIFASNGVWALTGSQGTGLGFTASDYTVSKISEILTLSHTSFVNMEGVPLWWNLQGIYTMAPEGNSITSLTYSTIDSFFATVLPDSKRYARGVYDYENKVIRWLYRSTQANNVDERYVYDKILNFDRVTSSFYGWTVDNTKVQLNSITTVVSSGGLLIEEQVVVGVNNVQVSGVNVVATVADNPTVGYVVKYLVSFNDSGVQTTFAEHNENNTHYADWFTFDDIGVPYTSYFITGFSVHGQAAKKFQRNYIYLYLVGDEAGTFKIRSRWDYATSGNTGRWGNNQIVTVDEDTYKYVTRRLKLRGQGLACQLYVENNGTEPFGIIGWATLETINQWI